MFPSPNNQDTRHARVVSTNGAVQEKKMQSRITLSKGVPLTHAMLEKRK
jgi:hypothetical protein